MMGPIRCDEVKCTTPLADSSISSKCLSFQDELIMSEKLSVAHLLKKGGLNAFFVSILMSNCYFSWIEGQTQ